MQSVVRMSCIGSLISESFASPAPSGRDSVPSPVAGAERTTVHEQCPYDPCVLVGERYGGNVRVAPTDQANQPLTRAAKPPLRLQKDCASTVDQQCSEVCIAPLADSEKALFAAGRILPWNKAEPRGKLSTVPERRRVSYARHQRRRAERPDARDGFQALAVRAVAMPATIRLSSSRIC